jgi:rhomboid protease GluP
MDSSLIIFLSVCSLSLTGLVVALTRLRAAAKGWIVVFLLILFVSTVGWLREQRALIYLGLGMWMLFVLTPGLISRLHFRSFLQQNFSAARRFARIISFLHPADGWREQPQIAAAMELAQRGDFDAASAALRRYDNVKSLPGVVAIINLHRMTQQWDALLEWESRHREDLKRQPFFFQTLLRARGETGDVAGLIEYYQTHKAQISKLEPAASRDLCRLMLFVFTGRRDLVEGLLDGSLKTLPVSTRQFWLATAELAAGDYLSARTQLEALLPLADPPLRLAIQHRLEKSQTLGSQPSPATATGAPNPVSALTTTDAILHDILLEQQHERNFGTSRTIFSKLARGTQILFLLNVLMFGLEMLRGGGENLDTLYRLGAFFPPAIHSGQWWRLISSLFLHYGPLHLTMNMIALALLGPFVEFALGHRKYFLVYFAAGIGSMGIVLGLASRHAAPQLMVGASGCVMGLVGATGALMLRGWIRDRALSARRRLMSAASIVVMQTVFDALVPQVSMTAHLSGALIGFLVALAIRDRLSAPARTASSSRAA